MFTDSIAQTDATQQPEQWWFTFGSSHRHPDTGEGLGLAYVVIPGSYAEARAAILASPFGNKWAFQYSSPERAGVERYHLHEVPMPRALDDASTVESKVWACPEGCGYHIADGPADDDEPTTDELIATHLEEHGYAADVTDPPQLVDEQVPEPAEPAPTVAQELAIGLRALADMLDANPNLNDDSYLQYAFGSLPVYTMNRAAVAAFARAAMGAGITVTKHQGDKWAGIDIPFGSRMGLRVFVEREEICERIVTGTHEVTEDVPDPEALAAIPKVTVTKVVEDVEWRCRPILAGEAEPTVAQVAEAALIAS